MGRRSKRLSILAVAAAAMLFAYTNCAKQFSTGEDIFTGPAALSSNSNDNLFGSGTCDQDLQILFANGYHKFLKTNCALCHTNGPGKGRFASGNVADALGDFMQTGYSKVSDMATSSSHQPPYSGPQHIQAINDLRIEWQKGLTDYANCSGTPVDTTPVVDLEDLLTLETTEKLIPSLDFDETATLEWDLSTDLFRINSTDPLPTVPGAKFSIQVGKYITGGGSTYYTFTKPRIFSSTVDIQVKTIQVNINGRLLEYPTTFRFIDAGIYKNSPKNSVDSLITTGSLAAPRSMSPADKVSVSFESISATTLPPKKPPVSVSFVGSSTRWVTATTGFVDVQLQLSSAAESPVTVTVSADSGKICNKDGFVDVGTCDTNLGNFICANGTCPQARTVGRARSVVGATFNRFDWDYKFETSSLTFNFGESTKSIRINFSKNIRKENNRLFTLQIDENLVGAIRGSQNKIDFVISKTNNPNPPVGVPTFSELMEPTTGILGVNCVKCHNSVNFEGGYDMTDYDQLIGRSRPVVIPGQVESPMYIRMNPSSPQFDTTRQMPRDAPLPVELRKEVEKWILNGALNN